MREKPFADYPDIVNIGPVKNYAQIYMQAPAE